MKTTSSRLLTIACAPALLLLPVACGGGETMECGEGTIEQDGVCVPVLDGVCAAGTHLEGGQCLPDAECGAGTHLEDGECVPDSATACGDGTVFDETTGTCIPVFADICGAGTVYDETTGGCLPDYDLLCPEGTIYDNTAGACVLPDPDVTEGAENNDPLTEGTPTTFTLPAENDTITVGGNVGKPADLMGDGTLYSDFDGFAFEATAGQVIRFEGTSSADLPSVAFVIVPADYWDDPRTTMSNERIAAALDGRNPVRTVRILETATYWLVVSDKDNLYGSGMTGGEGMDYIVGVTLLPTPADQSADLGGTVNVSVTGDPIVYSVSGVAQDMLVEMTVEDPSSTAIVRYLYVMDGNNNLKTVFYDQVVLIWFFTIGTQRYKVPDATGMKIFLDYDINMTGDADYDIVLSQVSVTDLGTLNDTVPIHSTGHTLSSETQMDTYSFDFTAPAGSSMTTISVDNRTPDFDATIVVRDGSYAYLADGTNLLQFTWDASATYYLEVYFGGTTYAGPYTYELNLDMTPITNVTAETSGDNDSRATAQALDITTVPALVNGSIDPAADTDYYAVTPASDVTLAATLSSATLDSVLILLDATGTRLDYSDSGFEGGPENVSAPLTGGQTYYINAYEYWGTETGDYSLLISY